ncbi:glycosyltransferase family 4 protein [Halegenticoccus soli]|uniref:glycosyltransferase family 4 protein n=1 Tax=Halegenticoccus soli TaxID=1985678 RepID=UPI000C6EC8B6|nr:glycosyltransferase family 4 protein [Halegenticoccus soli]
MSDVLVLTRDVPHPPNAGDRIVTSGFVRGLAARDHAVHLLSYGGDGDRSRAAALSDPCETVRLVSDPGTSLPPRIRKLGNALLGRSDVMRMFYSDAYRRAAAEAIRAVSPDVVLAEHPYMGQVFLDREVKRAARAADARLVTNAHVVEYAAHEAYRDLVDDPLARLHLRHEIPKLRREELSVYRASDRTLVLGAEDRAELDPHVPGPVRRQRVGLDLDAYDPAPGADADGARLLFFGSYEWFPNEDAVRYFARRVFPEIRARRPDAEFVVAGRGAPDSVGALDDRPGVAVVGEVADLGSAVRDAAAVVAPLRVGGGTRLKVLESMAWGAPVVTTAPGFEGVEARPGEDLLVADAWSEFVDATVGLLSRPDRRERIGRNAREAVESTYSIDAAAAELVENLGIA